MNQNSFLILRKIKYGESDLILHGLSSKGEKISFIARGALRSKKRFSGGVLDPGNFVMLTYKSKVGGLSHLSEASLLHDFRGLRSSYEHIELALRVLECADRVSLEGDDNSQNLYNLIGNTLKALESARRVDILRTQFSLKFLLQQGVLVLEDWMRPFLRAKLQDWESLLEYEWLVKQNQEFLQNRLSDYLATAEISSHSEASFFPRG